MAASAEAEPPRLIAASHLPYHRGTHAAIAIVKATAINNSRAPSSCHNFHPPNGTLLRAHLLSKLPGAGSSQRALAHRPPPPPGPVQNHRPANRPVVRDHSINDLPANQTTPPLKTVFPGVSPQPFKGFSDHQTLTSRALHQSAPYAPTLALPSDNAIVPIRFMVHVVVTR